MPSKMKFLRFSIAVAFLLSVFPQWVLAKSDPVNIRIAYLTEEKPLMPVLSNLDPILTDSGVQGARMAIEDNNTTGQFTNQHYTLHEVSVPVGQDVGEAFKKLVQDGYTYIVTNLPGTTLKKLTALPEASQALILNAAAMDDDLRNDSCSPNMLHLIPSRAMRADALAQFFLKKRWNKWLLIVGTDPEDVQFANALKRSAKQFGIKIVAEKKWTFDHDARRTAQAEVPAFTQASDYDVVMIADEVGLFGEYIAYQTWLPRLVAGTQGLVATPWHRTHERWGAVQMQNHFYELAKRWMNAEDYASWLAVRAIGEAATRTQSADLKTLRAFMLGDQFSLAGYKGVKLSFRNWNGQLRQPVLLASPRSMVDVMPLSEVLHPRTYLDTLGFDQPQSSCKF